MNRDPKRDDLVLVLDCGATNLRAIAVGSGGQVAARASQPNATVPDPDHADWHYWPMDAIFDKLARCARGVAADIDARRIRAVTVTTFGVDGTLVDGAGAMLFPVIAWKCPRTLDSQRHLSRYLDPDEVVRITGVGHFPFNTLNKFIWFRENRPDLLDAAKSFVFISSLLTQRLTGRVTNDATMVGTSQMADFATQDMSPAILSSLGVGRSLFPEMVFPGDVVGPLRAEAADALGLPSGLPVVSAGHDTQFAIFAAGAAPGRPVLSSGTWEILMARSDRVILPDPKWFAGAFTCEWDVKRGHYTPGYQYLASALVEWVARTMYGGSDDAGKFDKMISEARDAPADCHGVTVDPEFLTGRGSISGLSLNVDRGAVLRAVLNALVEKLREGLRMLEEVGGFRTTELAQVGGGARNRFWTELKANALGIPINTVEEPETTVLGAAMFAMTGVGMFASGEEARARFNLQYSVSEPAR